MDITDNRTIIFATKIISKDCFDFIQFNHFWFWEMGEMESFFLFYFFSMAKNIAIFNQKWLCGIFFIISSMFVSLKGTLKGISSFYAHHPYQSILWLQKWDWT